MASVGEVVQCKHHAVGEKELCAKAEVVEGKCKRSPIPNI